MGHLTSSVSFPTTCQRLHIINTKIISLFKDCDPISNKAGFCRNVKGGKEIFMRGPIVITPSGQRVKIKNNFW